MTNQILPLFIISILIFTSCEQQKVSTTRAMLFYDSINHQININRPKIQKFIDETTEAVYSLKNDKKAFINTRELILCLDTAKQMAKIRFSAISKITEVDYQINFKQRILNEERVLSGILNNEFEQCIKIFELPGEDKFEKCSSLIHPKLVELRKTLDDVRSAKVDFKKKYGFTRQSE